MYIICCHSLCVLLFFSQDYQRVPLLNFSEKYLGESLGSGVTGSHCWLASFFAISMRIGGFDVPQQVTNCEVFCEMSRIGHDVGIWWYLMVFDGIWWYLYFVHQNKIFILASTWGWEPKSPWDLRPRLSTFSPLFVCTRLGDSWDWFSHGGSRVDLHRCVNTDSSLRSHVTTAVNMMQPT